MAGNDQYTDATRASLQRIFGPGFTSPGGPDEMLLVLDGLDIQGKTVVDIGCGLGGDSLLLGGEFGATRVYSLDIDSGNLAVTREAVAAAGLEDTIRPVRVEPGPLPFKEQMFDAAHTKAMMCHLPFEVLADLCHEIYRVLVPGGVFVGADWMAGGESPLSPAYHDFADDLAAAGLVFFFKTADEHVDALNSAGFQAVECRDATPHIHTYAEEILQQVLGPSKDDLVSAMGEDGYAGMVVRSRGRAEALASGDLQFRYLKAYRPP